MCPSRFSTKCVTVFVYVNDMPNPKHHLNTESQFADDSGLWDRSLKATLVTHRLQEDLDAEEEWGAIWKMNLNNPEKTKWILFSRLPKEILAEALFSYFPRAKF